MSGFFDGLTNGNIRKPDVQFNVGPLPSTQNGPAGSNGQPDGLYNFNSNLLSSITPYAFGKPGTMGSDKSYQQIPHRSQQIIPLLHLPHADPAITQLVPLSHAVDQGDIAFLVGTSRVQGILFDLDKQMDSVISNSELPARNAFVNLPTVNYLLAGIQRLEKNTNKLQKRSTSAWERLAQDLNFYVKNGNNFDQILTLFHCGFVPFGICAGSENQGGLHETGLAPIQAAVNHVTTMTVDGQNRDLVNFWRQVNLDSGDDIILRLEWLPTQHFTLNHYYKGVIHQSFSEVKYCWQVVPDVFRMAYNPNKWNGVPRTVPLPNPYDYRLHGYWRIGRMFHHRLKSDMPVDNYSNDTLFLTGSLLHINFAPVWVQHCKCEIENMEIPKRDSVHHLEIVRKRRKVYDTDEHKPRKRFGFSVQNNLNCHPILSFGSEKKSFNTPVPVSNVQNLQNLLMVSNEATQSLINTPTITVSSAPTSAAAAGAVPEKKPATAPKKPKRVTQHLQRPPEIVSESQINNQ